MKNKITLTIFTFLGLVSFGFAQTERSVTLKEAVDLSIANSKQLKLSKARISEALASQREAEDRKLPDASAQAAYLRLTSANVDIKNRNPNSSGSTEQPNVNQAAYGIINISLPLYAGGRIRYGIESSKLLVKAAELDAENDQQSIIENTIASYTNLFKARLALDLVKENLGQAQQRVTELSSLERNGLLARNDLLKAELQASNTELTSVDVENNWKLANLNMNILLGLPDSTTLRLDSGFLQQAVNLQPVSNYTQTALNDRKDVASVELRRQAAEVGVKSIRAERLPSIALTGGYVAADIPRVLTVTNAANIGVGVSYSVGNLWKNKARVEGANARVQQLEANQELLNDNIRVQVNRAYLNVISQQKKIDVYAKAVEQANENYRITNNKFKNNLETTSNLLEADVSRLQSQLNYQFGKADALVAYYQLLLAAGQLNSVK